MPCAATAVSRYGPGHTPSQLFQDDGGLDHAEGAPAVLLRQREAEPAEPRHLLPEVVPFAARILPQGADDRRRHVLVEERASGTAEKLLVGASAPKSTPPP